MAKRDPWFDNAKMLLVTLVVVGHSWTLVPATWSSSRLYDLLYLWHMPAFVVVTGYLSRNVTWSRKDLAKLLTTVVVPYVLFEAALALFRTTVGGEKLEHLWINPHWPMWFLAALFFWRLAAPALLRLRPWQALALTVSISLVAGVVDIEQLDLSRVLGLLPFFTLGLVLSPHHWDRLRSPAGRRLLLPAIVVALAATEVTERVLTTEWLYWRTSYDALGVSWTAGVPLRLAEMAVALLVGAAVLAWLPRRDGWFARMGAASLVVYLFHGFAVKAALYAGVRDWTADHPALGLVTVTAGAVAVSMLLAHRRVAKPLAEVATPLPEPKVLTGA